MAIARLAPPDPPTFPSFLVIFSDQCARMEMRLYYHDKSLIGDDLQEGSRRRFIVSVQYTCTYEHMYVAGRLRESPGNKRGKTTLVGCPAPACRALCMSHNPISACFPEPSPKFHGQLSTATALGRPEVVCSAHVLPTSALA